MDSSEREELTARTSILKAELKTWERDFAAANDGKKASREDIKNDSEIGNHLGLFKRDFILTILLAAKYKEYNKARDLLSGKVVAPPAPRETPRKRKHAETVHIVSKRQQIAATPSKKTPSRGPLRPWELDPYDSPSVIRSLFTPSKKALGPTPQKEGQVLGLFDLLEGSVGRTPSKVEAKSISLKGPVAATPRKSRTQELGSKYSKTPGSLSKRRMLDAFSTPLKNRDEIGEEGGKTPSTVSKLVFSTPSFLRRDSHRIQLPTVNENEDGSVLSPQMIRVPRKPLVRGLSSMLAGLRKMEEEAADDDLEALHEMEMDMSSQTQPGPAPKPKLAIPALAPPVDIVEDSQNALLSAFDDEAKYDSDASASKDPMVERDSQLKIYKKKGQKRTTRRVNMKPTRSKPPSSNNNY